MKNAMKDAMNYQRRFNGTNLLPFIVFSLFCLITNPLLFYVVEYIGSGGSALFFGWVLGQIVLLNVISGLGGRHWINGFALAIALGAAGALLVMLCNVRSDPNASFVSSFFCLPAAVLIASLPHLAMRLIRRWRISGSDQLPSPIRIEDYFIMMAILGSSIALCRAHYVIAYSSRGMSGFSGEFGFIWLYFGCVFFVVNLLSLPAIALAYRPVPLFPRLVLAASHAFVVWIGMIVILTIMSGLSGGNGRVDDVFLYFLGVVGMTSFVANVGIQFLRLSGFWLRSKRDDRARNASSRVPSQAKGDDVKLVTPIPYPAEAAIDPFSDEAESMAEARAIRKSGVDGSQMLARWLTIALVWFALIANLFAFTYAMSAG